MAAAVASDLAVPIAATRLALDERRRWDGACKAETRDSEEWWIGWVLEGMEVRVCDDECKDGLVWRGCRYGDTTPADALEEEIA